MLDMFDEIKTRIKNHIYKDYIHKDDMIKPLFVDRTMLHPETFGAIYTMSRNHFSHLGIEKSESIAKKELGFKLSEAIMAETEVEHQVEDDRVSFRAMVKIYREKE